MKKCPECGKTAIHLFGENFCTNCGAEVIDDEIYSYRCSNSECRFCIEGREFDERHQYCGECGSPIIAAEKEEEA